MRGATINTPSMLCVEDYLDALKWSASIGGLEGLKARSNANLKALADWVAKTPWVEFLAGSADIRSNTSVCIKVVDKRVTGLNADAQAEFAKKLASLLEKEAVALDAGGYRDAPPGLRIWWRRHGRRLRRRGPDALAGLGLRDPGFRAASRLIRRGTAPIFSKTPVPPPPFPR